MTHKTTQEGAQETTRKKAEGWLRVTITRFTLETWAGLVLAMKQDEGTRQASVSHRLANAWLLTFWEGVEGQLPKRPEPGSLALYLGLAWSQAATTRLWPHSERFRELMAAPAPDHWLPRSQWHLCWLLHDAQDPHHSKGYAEAIEVGRKDGELPGYAAAMAQYVVPVDT